VATFRGVQDFALSTTSGIIDRNLGLGVTIADNAASFVVHGIYMGSIATFNATVLPALLRSIPFPPSPKPGDSLVEETGWIASLTRVSGFSTLAVPLTAAGYGEYAPPPRDNFFAKSVTTGKPFSEAALRRFFGFVLDEGVGRAAPVGWFSIVDLYGGSGSAVGRRDEGFAAYGGYGDLWVVQNCEFFFSSSFSFFFPFSFLASLSLSLFPSRQFLSSRSLVYLSELVQTPVANVGMKSIGQLTNSNPRRLRRSQQQIPRGRPALRQRAQRRAGVGNAGARRLPQLRRPVVHARGGAAVVLRRESPRETEGVEGGFGSGECLFESAVYLRCCI